MNRTAKKISILFAAGCLGGLLNSLVVWLFGKYGITTAFDVRISPTLSPAWLYPRIVWGGIWGLLFMIPLMRGKVLSRGLVMSLGPTAAQLFVVFPYKAGKGLLGLELGLLTPLFVLVFNAVWGVTTAFWARFVRD